MFKGIWQIKRSELTEEQLKWVRETAAKRDKVWRIKNRERLAAKWREYRRKNRERINDRLKKRYRSDDDYRKTASQRYSDWYEKNKKLLTDKLRSKYAQDNEYRSKIKSRNSRWHKNNRSKMAVYAVRRYHEKLKFDVQYTIRQRLSGQIYKAVKRGGGVKSAKTMVLCGCSIADLMEHLQSQFKEGMHWNNYGKWHIDHIRPCASFDLTDPEQQRQCFHYTNLQPLWARENIQKGARLITT
jgi:hypothetical protein